MHKINKLLAHKSLGLLILRVFIGVIFLIHGVQKFQNAEAMVAFFTQIGLNGFWMYTVATVETLGGVALILGVFTRFASILLSVISICAIIFFKWKLVNPAEPMVWLSRFAAAELDLALLGANLAMIFTGSGKLALWRLCTCSKTGQPSKTCALIGCEHDCHDGTCGHVHNH